MKKCVLNLVIVLSTVTGLFAQETPLTSRVYDWKELAVETTSSGERRQILDGSTDALERLEIHVTTLEPGGAPHGSHTHDDLEELIIIKEGLVKQTINGNSKILGPGSVVLASPGDEHGIENAGQTRASYYIIRWKSKIPVDLQRSQQAGGSVLIDWEELTFEETSKGGRRHVMRRPTATLEELEMHVTTLNEGVKSHDQHIHQDEEILLIRYGEVEEKIDDVPYRVGAGSLIFLSSDIPHGIRNVGEGPCEYYAIRWLIE